MNNNYSIKDIISMLLAKLWLIILVTFCGAVVAFCISKFMIAPKYSSHITLYAQSYDVGVQIKPDGSISDSKQLVNTYREVMLDDETLEAVIKEIQTQEYVDKYNISIDLLKENFEFDDNNLSVSSLRKAISIQTVTDTSAMNINVTTKDAKLSAAICNALAKVSPEYIDEAIGIGKVTSIGEAKVYDKAVSPSSLKNAIIGAFVGFVVIVLIVLAISFLDTSIKKEEDLSKWNVSVLGKIPQLDKDKKKKNINDDEEYFKITDENIKFGIKEKYLSIRSNVIFSLAAMENNNNAFVISSSNPNEGKSTVSSNLAISLAQMSKKVILVDADMRKNRQNEIFVLPNEKGLSQVISGEETLEESINKGVIHDKLGDYLDVLTSGTIPSNPSELLASKKMEELLKILKERYDYVVIDTPPLNLVTDAVGLSKNVGGYVIVVNQHTTTISDIDAVMKKLEIANAKPLGFVLNNVKEENHGYYHKYSKYNNYDKYDHYGYSNTKTNEQEETK